MRFPARTPEGTRQARKEQWRRDRAAAETLRSAFPSVGRIFVELAFKDPEGPLLASQSHTMHPPARAFFEFSCPYANCDGSFDLGSLAKGAIERVSPRATGSVECSGVRTRDGVTHRACGVHAHYTIAVEYQSRAESSQ